MKLACFAIFSHIFFAPNGRLLFSKGDTKDPIENFS